MAGTVEKAQASGSEFETSSQDTQVMASASASKTTLRSLGMTDSARVGLTVVALCCGIAVLGASADALNVYDATHLPADFLLPLWPEEFDLRPTVALCVGGAIVTVANVVSLVSGKVKSLRNRASLHTPLTVAVPAVGFVVALIAMAFFYAVNASTEVDTLQSWSCRWRSVNMLQRPHFGTLCAQSRAAVVLAVLLVPLELAILALALVQARLERRARLALAQAQAAHHRGGSPIRKESPLMS